MKGFEREDLLFSLCGLNCGLCSMQISGCCPGCGGGKGNQACAIARCSMEQKVFYCFECKQFPCERYIKEEPYDSFISHRHRMKDMMCMKKIGTEAYHAQQRKKQEILTILLENYQDGRKKTLFLQAVNLLELEVLQDVMQELSVQSVHASSLKEKGQLAAALLQDGAKRQGIDLTLRRKTKQKMNG